MIAKEETEDDMTILKLTKKQSIEKVHKKRINHNTLELNYIDQNGEIFLKLPTYETLWTNMHGKYKKEDEKQMMKGQMLNIVCC
jgi:hypothetical protein